MTVHCPKCGADISDSYEPDDWSVGIVGGVDRAKALLRIKD